MGATIIGTLPSGDSVQGGINNGATQYGRRHRKCRHIYVGVCVLSIKQGTSPDLPHLNQCFLTPYIHLQAVGAAVSGATGQNALNNVGTHLFHAPKMDGVCVCVQRTYADFLSTYT